MPQKIVVLGGGLAGLSAAYHLRRPCSIHEKEHGVGGHCRTKSVDGFSFDEGAHVFFGSDDCSREFILEPLASDLQPFDADIWNNYGDQTFGRYPVQANVHALPADLATKCIVDFVEKREYADDQIRTYEDWCYASFGRSFADHFMLRYARKVWTVEPNELTTDWLGSSVGRRISVIPLAQVIRGALPSSAQTINYLTRFFYPRSGGFARIVQPLAARVQQESLHLASGLVRVETRSRRMMFADGSEIDYDAAISTMPLPALVEAASDAPPEVQAAAGRLMWTSIRCVNIGVERTEVGPGHWCYFYDEAVPFFRVSFPSKFSPNNAPAGYSSISCEIAYSRRKPLDEEWLEERTLEALYATGVLNRSDRIVMVDQIDIPYAYVVFDFARRESVATIHRWMRDCGIFECGRFGEWGYLWSFEAIASGSRVAAEVNEWLR